MTQKFLVHCITRTAPEPTPDQSIISHLGGTVLKADGYESGATWHFEKQEVIRMITSGEAEFISGQHHVTTPVVVKISDAGNEYLTTEANTFISDNLSELPECD